MVFPIIISFLIGSVLQEKIRINNIKVFGYHGVYDKERDEGQYFYVNIIYSYDYDYPNDDIQNVKDYTKIVDYLLDRFSGSKYYLLEKLVTSLTNQLKREFGFNYLKLSISKEIDISGNKIDITIEKEISND